MANVEVSGVCVSGCLDILTALSIVGVGFTAILDAGQAGLYSVSSYEGSASLSKATDPKRPRRRIAGRSLANEYKTLQNRSLQPVARQ